MADYYPLLAKAVGGLAQSTPETRRAIYDRAQTALVNQLRSMKPPAPESAVTRETRALNEAIARLERELNPEAAATSPIGAVERIKDFSAPKTPEPDTALESDEENEQPRRRRDRTHPPAPTPESAPNGMMKRAGLIIGLVAIVIVSVSALAWHLRDKPEDLTHAANAPVVAQNDNGNRKIERRLGAQAEDTARSTNSASSGQISNAQNILPIAYTAALRLVAPGEPNGLKSYMGSIVWRMDSANRGPSQQLSSIVRGDFDIPDAGLKGVITLERNSDPALSATHTMSLKLITTPQSPLPAIKEIIMPEMRRDNAPVGDALLGIPIPIESNNFMMGLMAQKEKTNLDLLRNRGWIDIALSAGQGPIAKLTLEKGIGGSRVFNDLLGDGVNAPKAATP